MSRITRAHIVAARARKRILERQNKAIPEKITKLASLDPSRFPRTADSESHSRHAAAAAQQDLGYTMIDDIDRRL